MYVKINRGTCPEYLTEGKMYKAKRNGDYYLIMDDTKETIAIHPTFCYHLNKGSWSLYPNYKPSLLDRVKGIFK